MPRQPKTGGTKRPIGKDGKKKRRKKDPRAPKRPLSAFMLFANTNRDRIVAENNLDRRQIGELGRHIGAAWRALGAGDRKKYDAMAVEDKKRYEDEMKQYAIDYPRVKKPISAYMWYVQDVRPKLQAKNPDDDFHAIGKKLGAGWHSLSDVDKAPYVAKAEAAKAQYDKDKAAYGESPRPRSLLYD